MSASNKGAEPPSTAGGRESAPDTGREIKQTAVTREGVAYEVGKAQYREIARGQIIDDVSGLSKLIFECDSRKLPGVHIIGDGASELIHIGQAVLSLGSTIDYFINTVFNYATLAECVEHETAPMTA